MDEVKQRPSAGPSNATSKEQIMGAQRRQQCLDLRLQGASYKQIATAVGISPVAAWRHVDKALKEIRSRYQDTAAKLHDQEMLKLDRMELAMYRRSITGEKDDESATLVRLKIMERRARLMGLDAPTEIKTDGDIHIKVIDLTSDDDSVS
jgi:DNA-binding CsgD family transcriptional regulator